MIIEQAICDNLEHLMEAINSMAGHVARDGKDIDACWTQPLRIRLIQEVSQHGGRIYNLEIHTDF